MNHNSASTPVSLPTKPRAKTVYVIRHNGTKEFFRFVGPDGETVWTVNPFLAYANGSSVGAAIYSINVRLSGVSVEPFPVAGQ